MMCIKYHNIKNFFRYAYSEHTAGFPPSCLHRILEFRRNIMAYSEIRYPSISFNKDYETKFSGNTGVQEAVVIFL